MTGGDEPYRITARKLFVFPKCNGKSLHDLTYVLKDLADLLEKEQLSRERVTYGVVGGGGQEGKLGDQGGSIICHLSNRR